VRYSGRITRRQWGRRPYPPNRSSIRSAQVTIAIGTQNTLVRSYDGIFDYTLKALPVQWRGWAELQ
jgi:hypothetical protein